MVKLIVVVAAFVACREPQRVKQKDSAPPDAAIVDAEDEPDAAKPDEPAEPIADPGKAIADLDAIPAWQAVVDRAQYLARRGQRGVVFGTLGAALEGDLTWLVDDTEGNGALAIRVMLGKSVAKEGDRVALGGAWALDDVRRYYWKVDQLTPLAPGPPSDLTEPRSPSGHEITAGPLPPGARPISLAKDGDVVYFQLAGKPPAIDGEGWPIADQLGSPIVALLNLPGERPSFGGQDLRTPDERWYLKRAQTYWLRIGKIRRPKPDKPALINAVTAPMRLGGNAKAPEEPRRQ